MTLVVTSLRVSANSFGNLATMSCSADNTVQPTVEADETVQPTVELPQEGTLRLEKVLEDAMQPLLSQNRRQREELIDLEDELREQKEKFAELDQAAEELEFDNADLQRKNTALEKEVARLKKRKFSPSHIFSVGICLQLKCMLMVYRTGKTEAGAKAPTAASGPSSCQAETL